MTSLDTQSVPARAAPGGLAAVSAYAQHLSDRAGRVAVRCAPTIVRFAIAAIMLWFSVPKLFPGVSPAQDLAERTIATLTGGLIHGDTARISIAVLEIAIGLGFIIGKAIPLVVLVSLGHLLGTATPLVLFPAETWAAPGVGTLEGQYILKNLVLVAALIALLALRHPRPRHRTTAP